MANLLMIGSHQVIRDLLRNSDWEDDDHARGGRFIRLQRLREHLDLWIVALEGAVPAPAPRSTGSLSMTWRPSYLRCGSESSSNVKLAL